MKTKLKEGQIIKSSFFKKGNRDEYGVINVGTYINDISSVEENNRDKEYKILKIYEYSPQLISTQPFNQIIAIEINKDGSYDEKSNKISFSTMIGIHGAIDERNIEIVG